MVLFYILAVFAGALVGIAVYLLVTRFILKSHADAIVEKANVEAENIKQQKILQAKEKFLQMKSEHENFVNNKNNELRERENNIKSREGQLNQQTAELNKKLRDLESQKGQLNAQRNKLDAKIQEYEKLTAQVNSELENVAGMSAEEAKKMLVENMKAEARSEAQAYINDTIDEARLNAAKEAKRIVINTIQRTATETAIENAQQKVAAAYTAVDKGFKEYRGRVVERFGTELDKELRYNIKAKEFEEPVVDEKGKEKIKKETVSVADPNLYSDYARFFDDGCAGWSKSPEDNLTFLKAQQAFANQKLQWEGHLFLNDVYRMLGIPTTKAGQGVGWIYDEKNPIGDNFVDFGLYDINRPVVRDFVNGYERTILLDFNVDGNILDLM